MTHTMTRASACFSDLERSLGIATHYLSFVVKALAMFQ